MWEDGLKVFEELMIVAYWIMAEFLKAKSNPNIEIPKI